MVWKVFEKGGKWILVKEMVFRLFRALGTSGNESLTFLRLLYWQRWLNSPI